MSPRKVRLVTNVIKGLPVDRATDQLEQVNKAAARPVLKLLKSAIANAEHNYHLDRRTLRVKSIVTNDGPRFKRYRPMAFGRAGEILHRMSHVNLVLEDVAKSPPRPKTARPTPASVVSKKTVKAAPASPGVPPLKRPTPPAASDKERRRQAQEPEVARKGTS